MKKLKRRTWVSVCGLFQFLRVDGVGPGKPCDKTGFPWNEAEQEKVPESEERG